MRSDFSLTKHACLVGGVFVLLYAVCLLWPMVFPYEADVQVFHLLSLKLAFPGFQGFDLASMAWGVVLSFIYGFVAAFGVHAMHGGCCPKK